jgi:hypothetical protein
MADWYGTARTNYVRFKDDASMQAAKKIVDDCGMKWHVGSGPLVAMIGGNDEYGGFRLSCKQDDDLDQDYGWADIAQHLDDGQVLVCIEGGAEKLRYISGWAEAWNNQQQTVCVQLSDIYALARERFGVPIVEASYDYEPEPVEQVASEAPRT